MALWGHHCFVTNFSHWTKLIPNDSSSGSGDQLDQILSHHDVGVGSWQTPRLISVNTESSTVDDTKDWSPDYGKCYRDSREESSVEPQEPGSKGASQGHVPSRD